MHAAQARQAGIGNDNIGSSIRTCMGFAGHATTWVHAVRDRHGQGGKPAAGISTMARHVTRQQLIAAGTRAVVGRLGRPQIASATQPFGRVTS